MRITNYRKEKESFRPITVSMIFESAEEVRAVQDIRTVLHGTDHQLKIYFGVTNLPTAITIIDALAAGLADANSE